MKHFIPLLLLLVTFFSGFPREACYCLEKIDISMSADQHSCCGSRMFDCSEATTSLSNTKNCCGKKNQEFIAIASSIDLGNRPADFKVRLDILSHLNCVGLEPRDCVPCVNRAPPYLRGFGSSDTYLFKRTFLI